jgi:hypothetical protein
MKNKKNIKKNRFINRLEEYESLKGDQPAVHLISKDDMNFALWKI